MADLVVVGAGPGGLAAAREGRRLGASVTLVERAAPGGTCVHAGCIPAGALHRTAALLDELARAPAVGVLAHSEGVDWPRVQRWVGATVQRASSLARGALEAAGVEVLAAAARFQGSRLEAEDRSFEGVPVVLAPGAVNVVPAVPVPEGARVLTSTEAMALEGAPARLVVAGASRFGLEWADFFAHLGSSVVVVAAEERVLPAEDADLAGFLQLVLESRGIKFELGVGPEVLAGLEADAVLFADSRRPATEGMGLKTAGVALGADGEVLVDAGCRTSAEDVFAAGDVTGPPWLSNRAAAMGRVAAANALGGSMRLRPERIPRSVNTHPELAAVGLTEVEAQARGISTAVGFGELATSLRGITLGQDQGALKLVVDPELGEILGAHMVGVGATEVIAQVAAAMALEADYRDLGRLSHLHPSLAELVTEAIASI